MTTRGSETSPQRRARAAGVLYLAIIVCGLFGEFYVRARLIEPGDAAATAKNITTSQWLFRIGFASDAIMIASDIALAAVLYVLLKPVSSTLSLVAAFFRLVQAAILGVNLLNYIAALLLLSGAHLFEPKQLHALAFLFLDAHRHGYDLGLIFFGFHCLVLGYLLFRSGYVPRLLGVLMVLGSAGYLTGSFTLFLFPAHAAAISPVYLAPLVAEVSLCFWLLLKGVRVPAQSSSPGSETSAGPTN